MCIWSCSECWCQTSCFCWASCWLTPHIHSILLLMPVLWQLLCGESWAWSGHASTCAAMSSHGVYGCVKRGGLFGICCRDYCEELRDSLDLVPIGAWHGNGRKVGWYSPFLLAAYDPDTEEFQSVCRCMSGYTDAFYAEVTAARLQSSAVLACPSHLPVSCAPCWGLHTTPAVRHSKDARMVTKSICLGTPWKSALGQERVLCRRLSDSRRRSCQRRGRTTPQMSARMSGSSPPRCGRSEGLTSRFLLCTSQHMASCIPPVGCR